MRKTGLLILLTCLIKTSLAQDPNFSQFFVSPLTLNPALTGKFNGNFRVAGNYRDQWPEISKAFITSTISFDLPILTGKISELDTWACSGDSLMRRSKSYYNHRLIRYTMRLRQNRSNWYSPAGCQPLRCLAPTIRRSGRAPRGN